MSRGPRAPPPPPHAPPRAPRPRPPPPPTRSPAPTLYGCFEAACSVASVLPDGQKCPQITHVQAGCQRSLPRGSHANELSTQLATHPAPAPRAPCTLHPAPCTLHPAHIAAPSERTPGRTPLAWVRVLVDPVLCTDARARPTSVGISSDPASCGLLTRAPATSTPARDQHALNIHSLPLIPTPRHPSTPPLHAPPSCHPGRGDQGATADPDARSSQARPRPPAPCTAPPSAPHPL